MLILVDFLAQVGRFLALLRQLVLVVPMSKNPPQIGREPPFLHVFQRGRQDSLTCTRLRCALVLGAARSRFPPADMFVTTYVEDWRSIWDGQVEGC